MNASEASDSTAVITLDFAWDSLGLDKAHVFEAWHCAGSPWAETGGSELDPLLEAAADLAEPRAGWCSYPQVHVDQDRGEVQVAAQRLRPGPIVTGQLAGARGLLIFTATLGEAFDAWVAGFLAEGDVLLGYAADTIGAVAAEMVTDRLASRMADACALDECGCTHRFSPGYCGWDVAEQHALFALLPEAFCGIRLTPSAVMVPKKSVSGIVGTGPGVSKAPYPCAECDRIECLARGR